MVIFKANHEGALLVRTHASPVQSLGPCIVSDENIIRTKGEKTQSIALKSFYLFFCCCSGENFQSIVSKSLHGSPFVTPGWRLPVAVLTTPACLGWMQYMWASPAPGHWHTVNTQPGVYPFQGLFIHKLAHTSLPSNHPDHTLMPTNMQQQQQQQQHYYHNRWQETAAASASSKWAFGFVYLLSTLSCEH